MWGNAIWGMRRFVKDMNMFFEWSFIVLEVGERVVGNGWLVDISEGAKVSKIL